MSCYVILLLIMGQPNSTNQKNNSIIQNISDIIVQDNSNIIVQDNSNIIVQDNSNIKCTEIDPIKAPANKLITETKEIIKAPDSTENVNHGKYWTLQEENDLLDNIDKYTIDELAIKHGRTKGAIISKLKKIYLESVEKKNPITKIEKLININNIKKNNISDQDNTLNIYIIKCQHDKYYIGKSTNIDNRILEHFQQCGSAWTNLHKPIEVVDIIKNADNFDEDKYTKIYMAKYGIDNVRGGSYVQIALDVDVKKYLEKEINSTYDYCHRCGKTGHFINKCTADSHVDGTKLSSKTIIKSAPNHIKATPNHTTNNKIPDTVKVSNYCTKCGRRGHNKESCFAKTHTKGYFIK